MIVYGTGSKDLGEQFIPNETCPHCGAHNKIHIHGIARYFDVFWIPIFPFSKKVITICHSCEKEIEKKDASFSLIDKIGLEKSSFSLPIYLFSGLILIGLAIGWFQYKATQHNNFVENRIANLQKNDVLVIKENSKEYGFVVIDSTYQGNVFFKYSNYFLDQKPALSDYQEGLANKLDFINPDSFYYSVSEIDSLYNTGNLDILE